MDCGTIHVLASCTTQYADRSCQGRNSQPSEQSGIANARCDPYRSLPPGSIEGYGPGRWSPQLASGKHLLDPPSARATATVLGTNIPRDVRLGAPWSRALNSVNEILTRGELTRLSYQVAHRVRTNFSLVSDALVVAVNGTALTATW